MLNDFGKFSHSKVAVEECQKLTIQNLTAFGIKNESLDINDQNIKITTTPCYYGGFRYWFICPTCRTRVGSLYRKPLASLFLCRHCQNLTYLLRKFHRSYQEEILKQLKSIKY